jgi:hypothetical protein
MTTTPDRIDAARRALATAETAIAQLALDRSAALAESDDMAQISTIDQQLAEALRAAQAIRDRLAILEGKLDAETEQARISAYAESVNAIDASMVALERAGAEVEAAAMQLSNAAKLYTDAVDNIRSHWPANVPKPGTIHGSYPLSAHYVDSYRLGNLIRDGFTPNGPAQRIPPKDFVYRAVRAAASIQGFATGETVNRNKLIEELRHRGPPPVEQEDDVVVEDEAA